MAGTSTMGAGLPMMESVQGRAAHTYRWMANRPSRIVACVHISARAQQSLRVPCRPFKTRLLVLTEPEYPECVMVSNV